MLLHSQSRVCQEIKPQVWHDTFICRRRDRHDTFICRGCDITHSYVAGVTWHIHMSLVWHDTFIRRGCDMTHSYVVGVTWHIHMSQAWHDTFIPCKRDMTHSYVAGVTWHIHSPVTSPFTSFSPFTKEIKPQAWYERFIRRMAWHTWMSHMSHSNVTSDLCEIFKCDMRHSYVAWHDT